MKNTKVIWVLILCIGILFLVSCENKNESEHYGNTVGNISNSGTAAQDGDWIYYSNFNGLNKIHIDGTEKTRVSSDRGVNYLTIVDNWMYYTAGDGYTEAFYKSNTDGKEKTKLTDDTVRHINVIGDWIYYCNYSDNFCLYKIRTDGTERTKMSDEARYWVTVIGDWVYYCDINSSIYKIRIDGTKNTQINSKSSLYINISGDWIYYVKADVGKRSIYKMRADGTEITQLNDDESLI